MKGGNWWRKMLQNGGNFCRMEEFADEWRKLLKNGWKQIKEGRTDWKDTLTGINEQAGKGKTYLTSHILIDKYDFGKGKQ